HGITFRRYDPARDDPDSGATFPGCGSALSSHAAAGRGPAALHPLPVALFLSALRREGWQYHHPRFRQRFPLRPAEDGYRRGTDANVLAPGGSDPPSETGTVTACVD